jgi:hypothetical protein
MYAYTHIFLYGDVTYYLCIYPIIGKDGVDTKKTKNSSSKNKNKKFELKTPIKSKIFSNIFKYFIFTFVGIISILSIYIKYLYNYLNLNKKESINSVLLKNKLDNLKTDLDTNFATIHISNIFHKRNSIDTTNLIKKDVVMCLIRIFKKMMVILNLLIVFFTPISSWVKNIMTILFEKLEIQRYFLYILLIYTDICIRTC